MAETSPTALASADLALQNQPLLRSNQRTASLVMSQFESYSLTPKVKQETLQHYLAYIMAAARCIDQALDIQQHLAAQLTAMQERFDRYAVSPRFINHRQFNFLPSIIGPDTDIARTLPLTHSNLLENPYGLTWDQRLPLFEQCVSQVLDQAYANSSPPDALIHTTCSGYISPSPCQTYFSKRGWLQTQIIHAYHMGCYAAIPSVDMALGLLAASQFALSKPRQQVDILHTEIAALHLNPVDISANNIVNSTLFADTFIKYSLTNQERFHATQSAANGLKVLASETVMIPDTLQEMTWVPGPFQFDMYLSKHVPVLVGQAIGDFFTRICAQVGIDYLSQRNQFYYAVHPGGPKILDYISDTLKLPDDSMRHSREVLRQYGNMSSGTLPHVWRDLCLDPEIKRGDKILTVAFGPGLTATGFLMEKV